MQDAWEVWFAATVFVAGSTTLPWHLSCRCTLPSSRLRFGSRDRWSCANKFPSTRTIQSRSTTHHSDSCGPWNGLIAGCFATTLTVSGLQKVLLRKQPEPYWTSPCPANVRYWVTLSHQGAAMHRRTCPHARVALIYRSANKDMCGLMQAHLHVVMS